MAELTKNSYVLTVILHDVRKKTALEAAEMIQHNIKHVFVDYGEVGGIQVIASHIKDFLDCDECPQ